MRPGFIYLCSSLLSLALVSGCKQGEGDRCQVDSDCEDGLICCVTEGNRATGGKCFTPAQCETIPQDSGVTTDGIQLPDIGFFDLAPADLEHDVGQVDLGAGDMALIPDTAVTPDTAPSPDVTPEPDAS